MDVRGDIREFLTLRRAKVTPEQAGLPCYGSRRVPGLRREEVAVLAGISAPYYTRLERGHVSGVSESVLNALARALQLDDAERAHLYALVRAAQPVLSPPRPRPPRQAIRPGVQQLLDAMTHAAALLGNERLDILGANSLACALHSRMLASAARPVNVARFIFLDSCSRDFYVDWEQAARSAVAQLRAAGGRAPYDRALSDLVGELSSRSEAFRTYWASHDVRFSINGIRRLHHPTVGDLELNFEVMNLAADPGLMIFTLTAEPGSRSEPAFKVLGSRTAVAPGVPPAVAE